LARSRITLWVLVSVGACLLAGCTFEQILIGQIYHITTPSTGSCPALTWQFYVDARNQIHGTLAKTGALPMAELTGALGQDDHFEMIATNSATHRAATVSGQFSSAITTISIHGDAIDTGCDDQTFQLRLGGYFARQGSGGGGGGTGG
jgi:hypothetical protein